MTEMDDIQRPAAADSVMVIIIVPDPVFHCLLINENLVRIMIALLHYTLRKRQDMRCTKCRCIFCGFECLLNLAKTKSCCTTIKHSFAMQSIGKKCIALGLVQH